MSPAISVIIPVYKCEKYLAQCIESVLNQTFQDFELILVDDGSLDSSPQICDEYAQKDVRIQVIHKKNGGVSSARNEGIKVARGEYITFIDSDDYIDAEMFQGLYEKIKLNEGDLIISGLRYIFEETKKQIEYPLPDKKFLIQEIDKVYNEIKSGFGFSAIYAKLYKTEIIRDNQILYAEDFSILEDGSFVLEYLKYCSICILSNEVFYNYRQAIEMSLMKAFNSNAINALEHYKKNGEWLEKLLNKKNADDYYIRLYSLFYSFLIQIFSRSGLNRVAKKTLLKTYIKHSVTRRIIANIKSSKLKLRHKVIFILIKLKWSIFVYMLLSLHYARRGQR